VRTTLTGGDQPISYLFVQAVDVSTNVLSDYVSCTKSWAVRERKRIDYFAFVGTNLDPFCVEAKLLNLTQFFFIFIFILLTQTLNYVEARLHNAIVLIEKTGN
jgi:hypothetical protein